MPSELMPWECFQDASYYDMWCVRQVDKRAWGEGFHLINGDEAAALRDMLNTRPEPATPAGDDALVEELARKIVSFAHGAFEHGYSAEYGPAEPNDNCLAAACAILPIIHRREAAAHAAAYAKGRADERAEVVGYFRGLTGTEFHELYCAIADAIERGQHEGTKP